MDPSSGAGLTADIKTFEAHRIYGLGIPTAITYQHDLTFKKADWILVEKIIEQMELLKERFKISFIKIGLIENLNILEQLVNYIYTSFAAPCIIWDPVLKSSTGFIFHIQPDLKTVHNICKKIYLITPNMPESKELGTHRHAVDNAKELSRFCHVYLKGGHSDEKKGKDLLFTKEGKEFSFNPKKAIAYEKHGSGCVLSASITANLAKGSTLHKACLRAKAYTAAYLNSNTSLLGYHKL